MKTQLLVVVGFPVFLLTAVSAHPGGLNPEGCHTNRKTGEYHCHKSRGSPAKPTQKIIQRRPASSADEPSTNPIPKSPYPGEPSPTPGTITICSFNIAELGNRKKKKDHASMAHIIDNCDLAAIQEVQDKGGKQEIEEILARLNKLSTRAYKTLIIPTAGRGFPGQEGYAFLWREPVQLNTKAKPSHGLKELSHRTYSRIPAYAHFKAQNFDFVLASVHLAWGDTARRTNEVADIKTWLTEYSNRPKTLERDLIVAGDTNRYGKFTLKAISQKRTAFHVLTENPGLNTAYRLIFCEFLPSLEARYAPLDEQSTTVSQRRDLYDQIWISEGAFHEFGTAKAEFGKTVGTVAFDRTDPWSRMGSASVKSQISDHRPIWARFRTDLDDDDGSD